MKSLESAKGIILDIGGGMNKKDHSGVLCIDNRDRPETDILWNLEVFPWPILHSSVSMAVATGVVSHINPANGTFVKFMNEIWRIMKPGGELLVSVPYATSMGMFRDPMAVNFVTEETWCYFDPEDSLTRGGLYSNYHPLPWRIKINTWDMNGTIETALVKREVKKEYGVSVGYLCELEKNSFTYGKSKKDHIGRKAS